jgi:hypothetical protein
VNEVSDTMPATLERIVVRFVAAVERCDWRMADLWIARADMVCRLYPEIRPGPSRGHSTSQPFPRS